jgi:putative oxidoreductase
MTAIHAHDRPIGPAVAPHPGYLLAPGRALMSIVFLMSGFGKIVGFSTMVGYASAKGLPAPKVMIALAAAAELAGGLSLLLGFLTRAGAFGLFLFLIPTTLVFHNFWVETDPMMHQMQMVNFLKNLAIMGGLLAIAAQGAGPLSIDAMRRRSTV